MKTMNIKNSDNITEELIIEENFVSEVKNWDELELDSKLLRGIFAYGFEKPSPIQQKAIKPIIEGRDVIAQAQSGTGKTATFTIGALQRINLAQHKTQVLILSPTRELATQTSNVISNIGCFSQRPSDLVRQNSNYFWGIIN